MLKSYLIHLIGYFGWYCQILELFPPFKRNFIIFFQEILPNKWISVEELKKNNSSYILEGLSKRIVLELETCWDILKNPVIRIVLLLWSRLCLVIVEFSTKSVAPVSIRTEGDLFLI